MASNSRFSSVIEEDLKELLLAKDSKNTQNSTKVAFNVFESYLKEKKIEIDIENVGLPKLNDILTKFYVEVRKQDGSLYSKATLNSIRFGIQRERECSLNTVFNFNQK